MAKTIRLPKLEPWQMDVYKDAENASETGKIFVVKAKRQVGKSILAVCLLIKYALTSKCVSLCVEPTLTQSRRIFKQVCDFLNGSGTIVSANAQLLEIQFVNGSEIIFKSAEQREALRGYSVSGLLVIDEGAFIDRDIFEILYAMTDARMAPILVISTPFTMDGEFYNLYMRGLEGNGNVKSYDWCKYDTSVFLPPERLEYYRQTVSRHKFINEYLGEFLSLGEGLLFQNLDNCIGVAADTEIVYMGIDFGTGSDEDYTVLSVYNVSGEMLNLYRTNKLTPMQQVDWLCGIILDWASNHTIRTILAEHNSIGSVYIDAMNQQLRSKSLTITNWVTSNKSKQELVTTFQIALENERVKLISEPNLLNELRHYQADINPKTKTVTYNGYKCHDDCVMSAMLGYYAYHKGLGKVRITLI